MLTHLPKRLRAADSYCGSGCHLFWLEMGMLYADRTVAMVSASLGVAIYDDIGTFEKK